MRESVLSIFIDESGDFGRYDPQTPYYIVTMVLHDQNDDITGNIVSFEHHLAESGYKNHAIHTGSLIRRESVYDYWTVEERKHLFNALFYFSRKLPVHYVYTVVEKSKCHFEAELVCLLEKAIMDTLWKIMDYLKRYSSIIVYYDNGQNELTKILESVFHTLFPVVEFRKVKPVDYKLFQVADLMCTVLLLENKAKSNSFSKSEKVFFGNSRNFKKEYLKAMKKKVLE